MEERWIGRYLGEVVGTFLLVLFGCAAVIIAVLYGQASDLFSAGLAWGFAVALAIYVAGSLSGAHINPAVTLGFAISGRHPWRQVVPYWICQVFGGFLGAAVLVLAFGAAINHFVAEEGFVIGQQGSEKVAMMLAPYSPHPWIVGTGPEAYAQVPIWRGFLTEVIATAVLLLIVRALIESRSVNAPTAWSFPLAIVLVICMLTVLSAPLTMTSLNPARDLGPRTMLWFMGFGEIAFPGIRGGLSMLVTVGGPLVGGAVGSLFFDLVLRPFYPPVVSGTEPAGGPEAEPTADPQEQPTPVNQK